MLDFEKLDTAFDAQAEELREIPIRPKASNIHVPLLGLLWMPYRKDESGRLQQNW